MKKLLTHLKERYVNTDLYKNLVVSEEEFTATFMLWNLSGQLVGYQQYKPFRVKTSKELNPRELRYFTYVTKYDNKNQMTTAFGLDLLDYNKKYVFVCEGVFDAVRLHNLGLNALALLSCNPKQLKSWLWSFGFVVVPVCEGDDAGKKLAKLANTKEVVFLPENKDLGDLSNEEVFNFFKKYLN